MDYWEFDEVNQGMVNKCSDAICDALETFTEDTLVDICTRISELDHADYFEGDEVMGRLIAACAQLTILSFILVNYGEGEENGQ